ncbi:hypothetical protein ABIE09_001595 [Lysobacter enzymogenes]|uniref:hypothetical protein n=1 Tax=Lysobacter enzymogenes TaxID=69 RepID=UPI0031CD8B47|nr:hypothetical protein [Lysobacter enzymogenes]
MDLETIGEVVQIDDVQEVNQRLQDGWVVLAVAPGTKAGGEPWLRYSLGLPYEDEDEEDEDEEEGDEEEEDEDQ